MEFTLKFFKKGEAVAGELSFQMGEAGMKDIGFDGKNLRFTAVFDFNGQAMEMLGYAQIEGDTIKGSISNPMLGKAPFSGEKEKK